MNDVRLVLFDRDGTLTYEQMGRHASLEALSPYPFAGPLLKALEAAGRRLAVVTNQSGIGRGVWQRSDVDALHERFCAEWGVSPAFYLCPHAPTEGCSCRKPEPGLLLQALEEHELSPRRSLMVGDSLTDAGAADSAGIPFALVLTGRGRVTREKLSAPPAFVLETVADLHGMLA
ncbi:MAG: HAD-IIIA family hydrolase [Candidatus Neomarinimicrobiota bacterium]